MTLPPLAEWAGLSVAKRVGRVCALRHVLAQNPQPFVDAIDLPFRRSPVETLAAEIIPLADACLFLERHAARLLRPTRLSLRGRPLWLWGTRAEIHRQPFGRMLIIGPANYPLILPGVQIIQGLVAGNGILFKPAAGTHAIAKLLSETLRSCGVPDSAMILLDQSPDAAKCYYSQIDKVIVTGSADTGQAVARDLAEHNKPAIMELSGCDAAIVLPNADIQLAAACIRFGLAFNGSNSCIAPRRLLVHASVADALVSELAKGLATIPALPIPAQFCPRIDELVKDALDHGAKLVFGNWPAQNNLTPLLLDYGKPCMRLQREDIGLPIASIVRVNDVSGIIAASARCPFKLGASIFGPPDEGMELAKSLDAGSIVINDCMAPTADPRLPFGGGGASGFGSTRGAEGLLQMTRPKTIQACTHSLRFHLRKETASTADLLRAQLQMTHARTRSRQFAGLKKLIACARTSRKETTP